mgnify:CR=1 FL=1
MIWREDPLPIRCSFFQAEREVLWYRQMVFIS